uniref:Uncharacterized protein n=1 Tax=Glossina pallidipes TaxID=7398 RepID=A0A1A9ZQC1_GLOPL
MSLPMRKESTNDKVKALFKNVHLNLHSHQCTVRSVHRTSSLVYQSQALTLVEFIIARRNSHSVSKSKSDKGSSMSCNETVVSDGRLVIISREADLLELKMQHNEEKNNNQRYHYGLCVYWWMLMLMLRLMSDENDSEADDIMR